MKNFITILSSLAFISSSAIATTTICKEELYRTGEEVLDIMPDINKDEISDSKTQRVIDVEFERENEKLISYSLHTILNQKNATDQTVPLYKEDWSVHMNKADCSVFVMMTNSDASRDDFFDFAFSNY